MGFLKEFRDFAMRGNVVDMAVGIIIGAAFGRIVSTLVDKVMMPPLGYVIGGIDFADKKVLLKPAVTATETVDGVAKLIVKSPEVAIYYGEFINVVINFIIVAFALFVVIKAMNQAKKRLEREQGVPAAPAVPADVVLLTEIRDLLKQQRR